MLRISHSPVCKAWFENAELPLIRKHILIFQQYPISAQRWQEREYLQKNIKANFKKDVINTLYHMSKAEPCLDILFPTCSKYLTLGAAPFRSKCTIFNGSVCVSSGISGSGSSWFDLIFSFFSGWTSVLSVCSFLTGSSWLWTRFSFGICWLAQNVLLCRIWWVLWLVSLLEL